VTKIKKSVITSIPGKPSLERTISELDHGKLAAFGKKKYFFRELKRTSFCLNVKADLV
jgi:hypothetical protein